MEKIYEEKYVFSNLLDKQLDELSKNPLLAEFKNLRRSAAQNPHWPQFHFTSPNGLMHDPNGLSFWGGKWHLFYQGYPTSTIPNSIKEYPRTRWGHAISEDLVHWSDLPYAIYPDADMMAFSGSIFVEEGRAIAMYPEVSAKDFWPVEKKQRVAISSDPLLLNWDKLDSIEQIKDAWDADIWKEDDTYYSLIGGHERYYPESDIKPYELAGHFSRIFGLAVWPKWMVWKSKDLNKWEYLGNFIEKNAPFTQRYEDGSCPNFEKIGDKHLLLFTSHGNGGQYFLGDYRNRKFIPYDHGRFNHGHGQIGPGGVMAPSAVTDNEGGVITVFNITSSRKGANLSDELMSLPVRLTLDADKRLKVDPVQNIEKLRYDHVSFNEMKLLSGKEIDLNGVQGNSIEIIAEIEPGDAQMILIAVLKSPDSEEATLIKYYNNKKRGATWPTAHDSITLDTTVSSLSGDLLVRPPETASLRKHRESLVLRIFVDRSVVEIFANGSEYIAGRAYPMRNDSNHISIKAIGGDAILKKMDVWKIGSIWQ